MTDGGEVHDITVEILKDIRTDIRELVRGQVELVNGQVELVNGQVELVNGQARIEKRLDNMLMFIGERYADLDRRLHTVEDKLAES